jgi:hypothetical protein
MNQNNQRFNQLKFETPSSCLVDAAKGGCREAAQRHRKAQPSKKRAEVEGGNASTPELRCNTESILVNQRHYCASRKLGCREMATRGSFRGEAKSIEQHENRTC